MAVRLNKPAFEHAKHLLTEGKFVADQRGSWSEHQPSAAGGNEFIRLHDYEEFGKWLLGIDDEKSTRTKAGRLVWGMSRMSSLSTRMAKQAAPPSIRGRNGLVGLIPS